MNIDASLLFNAPQRFVLLSRVFPFCSKAGLTQVQIMLLYTKLIRTFILVRTPDLLIPSEVAI